MPPSQEFTIVEDGLDDPRVIALLVHHIESARAQTEPGSAHALSPTGLRSPEVRFWSAWRGDELLGVGALKALDSEHGEVKSMHTAAASRGTGVGGAILRHIISVARGSGLKRLSLETGSWDYFKPAHRLYQNHGFKECEPFADYRPDPNSLFFTLNLAQPL